MTDHDYEITVDGGCRGNGTDNAQCYGSARIATADGREKWLTWEDIPSAGTNNEAEYEALGLALGWLERRLLELGADPARHSVLIRMDSALVLNQVFGTWKCGKTNPQLLVLRDFVRELVARFGRVDHEKLADTEVKAILGH